jgi:cell division protein FtsW (lipid II flippase)
MKVKPTYLFLLLSFLVIVGSLFIDSSKMELHILNFYSPIDYFEVEMLFIVLFLFTTFSYIVMNTIDKPISNKMGYLHFGLFTAALLFIIIFITQADTQIEWENQIISIPIDYNYIGTALLSVSILLFLAGFIVFLFAALKAVKSYKYS